MIWRNTANTHLALLSRGARCCRLVLYDRQLNILKNSEKANIMMIESKGLEMSDQLISTAERLAARPYAIEVRREPGKLSADVPRYTAYIKQMPYCVAQGFTEAEARQEIRSVLIDYILSLLDRNLSVPEPEAISFSSESEFAIK